MRKLPPVALAAGALLLALASTTAQAGKTLDAVKARGTVKCGVTNGVAGFSAPDTQGNWSGLDVDTCRAIAAAVLGDAKKAEFVPLNSQQRFAALQAGEVDILTRNTTWNLTRDASLGLNFTTINYYDGQGFLVPKKIKVTSAKQLKGATICTQAGTTNEKNVAEWSKAQGIPVKTVVFESFEASFKAFFSGRCQAFTTDTSALAGLRNKEAPNPDDYLILPDLISKEPLAPAVKRGDDEWFAIVKWVPNALIEAEELGITQANIDQLRSNSKDPAQQRLVGTGDDLGKLLGLDKDWSYHAIKAVGNHGEMFERNVGPKSALQLPRGFNNLWNRGGLLYAMPVR
ncbi:amino acid ABC transporter substrate-binding protein [Pseudorhodoferax sp. Leaf265]|jgi:general L-amino acid transport system substrate-binding protein|uniref:amino acid ABC transporter substrate-binding protein n=1 Tax=Pseudorhodoferax sp. Leaf265 TaxID=1736315 RepID=UPI0007022C9F|nr:amino acid ABC transporter substrate-binding protein [Pseudorhodoferax sp. Leaf265]KQP04307.1 amino acid ABC transporter substrate-binding protein [Pseudorhodoferax sp. Leaf265]PZP95042.1 MAG: amino acid ABC transporter substrate-binding protein [Variovorax paradoxus]PZQ05742.1 MAG: amino acid ABC transporter substrate-binding protein [Variovorax paradoxus]